MPRLTLHKLVPLLVLAAGPALADPPATGQGGLRQACAADYRSLCPGVAPGGGRILACFKENADKLSAGCRQALEAAKAARSAPSGN